MKIDNHVGIGKLGRATQQDPAEAPGDKRASEAPQGGDTSRVSDLARQIAEARRAADLIPDVRSERLVRARERLASGFYDTPEAREVLVSKLAALVKDNSA